MGCGLNYLTLSAFFFVCGYENGSRSFIFFSLKTVLLLTPSVYLTHSTFCSFVDLEKGQGALYFFLSLHLCF